MKKKTAVLDWVLRTKAAQRSESLRFHVDGDAVTEVFWEHSKIETGSNTSPWQTGNKSAASWFTSAASALFQRKDSRCGLWGFEILSNLLTFTKQDSIPCGVMVVLGMIAEGHSHMENGGRA